MSISYQEALKIIQLHIKPLHVTQTLPLLSAINHLSSENIYAPYALPKHPMSLKDGYGIALMPHTAVYTLLQPPYPPIIPAGFGIKLSTGERIQDGITTVIGEEEVCFDDDNTIRIALHVKEGEHLKQEGEDITKGEFLLKQFKRITAQKITALSSFGIETVATLQKPSISILSIGNQLASKEIYNSNAMSIAARLIEMGASINTIELCEEKDALILEKLSVLTRNADWVITTGAMSNQDVMCRLLETHLTPLFHHVRIAPAKPSALSLFNNTPILHLTGLPLSCMLGFEMLGVPLLRQLQHQTNIVPPFMMCINQKSFTCKAHCMSAIPGYNNGGSFIHAPFYEAGRLNILSQCNGYTLVEDKEVIEEGEEIPFFFFTHPPVS